MLLAELNQTTESFSLSSYWIGLLAFLATFIIIIFAYFILLYEKR